MYYNDLFYCEIAKHVYDDSEEFRHYNIQTIDIDNCRARIYTSDAETIVAYCGTDDLLDIKQDLSVTLWKENYGRIHRGFRDYAHKLYGRVAQIAQQSSNITLVGHSLGGAAATITAYWLQMDFPQLSIHLYTYGSPRTGWPSFVKKIDVPHRRWVNNNDIVPRMPTWLFGYCHNGKPLYINSKGKLAKPSLWDRILGYRKSLIDPLRDHLIDEYLHCIQNLTKEE